MGYAKTALMMLRLGVGLYLIFIAAARLLGYHPSGSFSALYNQMGGGGATSESAIALGASLLVGVLGFMLLSGRLLVVSGVLVALVCIASGIGEFLASSAPGLVTADRATLVSNGVRDILVLATMGGAIAALDSYVRHRRYDARHPERSPRITFHREEPVRETAYTTPRSTYIDNDEAGRGPLS